MENKVRIIVDTEIQNRIEEWRRDKENAENRTNAENSIKDDGLEDLAVIFDVENRT